MQIMNRSPIALALVALMISPMSGSIAASNSDESSQPSSLFGPQLIGHGQISEVPEQGDIWWDPDVEWWEVSTLDEDRDGIHDSIQNASGPVNIGLSFSREISDEDRTTLESLGFEIHLELPIVDAVLLGDVHPYEAVELAELDGVAMVERYGSVVFYGDVQTPAVKASNSSEYPIGAWDFGLSGTGINIAMVDTGVDNEHPGLEGKFVAGYDAVCYLHSDPQCILSGGRAEDGSFDPDDGNQHGTACMGMASATGLEADGTQSSFYGSAPDAGLVDVRIGTDVGAGRWRDHFPRLP